MNTPKSKKPKRFGDETIRFALEVPEGGYVCGLSPNYSEALGHLIANWPHLEEAMIRVMASLLGDRYAPARQIFRSLSAERARVQIMLALLQEAEINRFKDQWFDDVLTEFSSLNKIRNDFVHGLWHTHEAGKVFLQAPSAADLGFFNPERQVKATELTDAVRRVNNLTKKIHLEIDVAHKRGSSPEKHPPQRSEETP